MDKSARSQTSRDMFLLSNKSSSLNLTNSGLTSITGAQEVIRSIGKNRKLQKLILGHNTLQDAGCIHLFEFLSSPEGVLIPISEISLISNSIGGPGFQAIARYLKNNRYLKELFLQHNTAKIESSLVDELAKAVNSSRLETLMLGGNRLSDEFAESFFPKLDAPKLRGLSVSIMGFSPKSAPYILSYISSPRCRLHILTCNGNSIGFGWTKRIIKAAIDSNFTLRRVELFANQSNSDSWPDSAGTSSSVENESDGAELPRFYDCLRFALTRNEHLGRLVEKESLFLLRYGRALSLYRRLPETAEGSDCHQTRFLTLPTELRLYVFSFLTPTLSHAQRLRVLEYASTYSTLPSLLPKLKNNNNLGWGGFSVPCQYEIGSFSTRDVKREQRRHWIDAIGCASYEKEG